MKASPTAATADAAGTRTHDCHCASPKQHHLPAQAQESMTMMTVFACSGELPARDRGTSAKRVFQKKNVGFEDEDRLEVELGSKG